MLRSELDLFRDAERIVDLDAEVANGAFQLCVPEEQLDRPQVAGLLVNLRHLCSLHRVRPISRAIETGAFNLAVDDTSVLPCRYVRLIMKAARKEVLAVLWCGTDQPIADCCSGLFGDLELDRPPGLFLLDYRGSVLHSSPTHTEPHEVAAPQLAVDGEIEQSETVAALFNLEPDANCPDPSVVEDVSDQRAGACSKELWQSRKMMGSRCA